MKALSQTTNVAAKLAISIALSFSQMPFAQANCIGYFDSASGSASVSTSGQSGLTRFAKGEVPDLNNPNQAAAFAAYRLKHLGDPTTQLNPGTANLIAKIMAENPTLTKIRFSSVQVESRVAPKLPESVSKLINQTKQNAQIANGKIYKVNANIGFWNKIFQALPAPVAEGRSLLGRFADGISSITGNRLGRFLPEELVAKLENETISHEERAEALMKQLITIRDFVKEKEGADFAGLRTLSQVIVDVAHAMPFMNKDLANLLKSDDGATIVNTFDTLLEQRDLFVQKFGYQNYAALLQAFGLKQPSVLPMANDKFVATWIKTKTDLLASWESDTTKSRFTIRQLSPIESVYRSCLGKNECSSRTYPTKALDPNYNYFTMTDDNHNSSGHLTVVLGEGTINGKKEKLAFIDKIQNVPLDRIPSFLEGVRESLKEQGYLLTSAKDPGNTDGLSNTTDVRTYFSNYLPLETNQPISDFAPHAHGYNFEAKHSRAASGLKIFLVSPIENKGLALTKIPTEPFKKASEPNIQAITKDTQKLAEGTDADKIAYIKTQEALRSTGHADPAYEGISNAWLSSSDTSFAVKKQVILSSPPDQIIALATKYLNEEQKTRFFTSVVSSPFSRKIIGLDNVYEFLEANPEYLKQLSSKSFESFSIHRLVSLKTNRVLKAALESGVAKINKVKEKNGATPLNTAAADGNLVAVELLLRHGADANEVNNEGRSGLIRSVINQHNDVSAYLIENAKSLDLDLVDSQGRSATTYALRKRSASTLAKLLRAGASPLIKNIYEIVESTIVIEAVKTQEPQLVEASLQPGFNLEILDSRGRTALMYAAANGDTTSVRRLLKAGASKKTLSQNNHDAAFFARKNGHVELANELAQ